jgi:hypothetical protein
MVFTDNVYFNESKLLFFSLFPYSIIGSFGSIVVAYLPEIVTESKVPNKYIIRSMARTKIVERLLEAKRIKF